MRQPAMRCVEFVESVTDWMEGELGGDERLEIEEHVAICPHCAEYVEQLRTTRALLRRSGSAAASPPPEARRALLEAFKRQSAG